MPVVRGENDRPSVANGDRERPCHLPKISKLPRRKNTALLTGKRVVHFVEHGGHDVRCRCGRLKKRLKGTLIGKGALQIQRSRRRPERNASLEGFRVGWRSRGEGFAFVDDHRIGNHAGEDGTPCVARDRRHRRDTECHTWPNTVRVIRHQQRQTDAVRRQDWRDLALFERPYDLIERRKIAAVQDNEKDMPPRPDIR